MESNRTPQVDLAQLFGSVTQVLKENQQSLNTADEYNHNHGNNMVNNFQVIAHALQEKQGASPTEQLSYASEALGQSSQSSSAQLYSQGLAQAADRFQGKPAVTQDDAMMLVHALMGGQPDGSQTGGGTMNLLSGLLGGQPGQQQGQSPESDPFGGLLGALTGGMGSGQQTDQFTANQSTGGIDINTLMTAGMAFFQARQQGAEPLSALVQAVMSGSQMQSSPAHSQSGQLVAGTLINTIGQMLAGRK